MPVFPDMSDPASGNRSRPDGLLRGSVGYTEDIDPRLIFIEWRKLSSELFTGMLVKRCRSACMSRSGWPLSRAREFAMQRK